jgi:hypothetical protein
MIKSTTSPISWFVENSRITFGTLNCGPCTAVCYICDVNKVAMNCSLLFSLVLWPDTLIRSDKEAKIVEELETSIH